MSQVDHREMLSEVVESLRQRSKTAISEGELIEKGVVILDRVLADYPVAKGRQRSEVIERLIRRDLRASLLDLIRAASPPEPSIPEAHQERLRLAQKLVINAFMAGRLHYRERETELPPCQETTRRLRWALGKEEPKSCKSNARPQMNPSLLNARS